MGHAKRIVSEARIDVELIAVLAAVIDGEPRVLTLDGGRALPSGPLEYRARSLQASLRERVRAQTGLATGYLEQLYTFADRDRSGTAADNQIISISYLGLTRVDPASRLPSGGDVSGPVGWRCWYDYFPWEDHREGRPESLCRLVGDLNCWAESAHTPVLQDERRRRIVASFGAADLPWKDEAVLQRYELLHEAGLVAESGHTERGFGLPMLSDHRRILATGIARLRAKIRYRPVVFELMPDSFTLLQLQRSVEALAGVVLHKQNFRRLIEQQDLVEETGEIDAGAGGRPAKLFRFRHAVVEERAFSGSKLPIARV
jgi:hypothetical protein